MTRRRPLIGDHGQLIETDPSGRYEIREASTVTFPAEVVVSPSCCFQFLHAAGPDLVGYLSEKANTDIVIPYEFLNHVNEEAYSNILYGLKISTGLKEGDAVVLPPFDLVNCHHIILTDAGDYCSQTYSRSNLPSNLPLLQQQLADCYRRCLEEALALRASSIAFPCLGVGSLKRHFPEIDWPIGVYTVKKWFDHPIHGSARRAAIQRVTFLADPLHYGHLTKRLFRMAFSIAFIQEPERIQSLKDRRQPQRPSKTAASQVARSARAIRKRAQIERGKNLAARNALRREAVSALGPKRDRVSRREMANLHSSQIDLPGGKLPRLRRRPHQYGQ